MTDTTQAQEDVRAYYREKAAEAARAEPDVSCCAPDPVRFGPGAYVDIQPGDGTDAALLASLGCGNPTAVAELREGETVLDLGSGAGLDLILSARRVGPDGRVFGLDFLEEMLAVARTNIEDAEIDNIVLLKGNIEQVPLPAGTVDVIISNCVINLSLDKPAVFAEMARVLAPGGRLGISDVVAEDHLTAEDRAERGSRASCVAGALSRAEYLALLAEVGFVDGEVEFTQEAADGMHAAIIRARKPGEDS
ncbi:methyltransferase domain-containing protein [Labedaea rhizosphaerae]|uniref:Arsenite methyltransferase n=1 Tax=Labedaea rhizosphaerae TaxID=598644 RepID=A0A4R6RQC9_LABRH|nr:methyltransferase domain-containing protein [Labedaea rhizosphaerae]TDP88854.1 methyltransferase family protein [Labedaea rhizosphaerae]